MRERNININIRVTDKESEIEVNLINIRERILDAYYEKEDGNGNDQNMGN